MMKFTTYVILFLISASTASAADPLSKFTGLWTTTKSMCSSPAETAEQLNEEAIAENFDQFYQWLHVTNSTIESYDFFCDIKSYREVGNSLHIDGECWHEDEESFDYRIVLTNTSGDYKKALLFEVDFERNLTEISTENPEVAFDQVFLCR